MRLDYFQSEDAIDDIESTPVKILFEFGKQFPPFAPIITGFETSVTARFRKRWQTKINILLRYVLDSEVPITRERIEDIQTISGFGLLLDATRKMENNTKIIFAAKLFANTFFDNNEVDWNEYEEWLGMLTSCSYREIWILGRMYEY